MKVLNGGNKIHEREREEGGGCFVLVGGMNGLFLQTGFHMREGRE